MRSKATQDRSAWRKASRKGVLAVPLALALAIALRTSPAPALDASPQDLFDAIAGNNRPLVELLVEGGVGLDSRNEDGETPAEFALGRGHFVIAHYLLSYRPSAKPKRSTETAAIPPPPKRPESTPPGPAGKREHGGAPARLEPTPYPLSGRQIADILERRDIRRDMARPRDNRDEEARREEGWSAEIIKGGPDVTAAPPLPGLKHARNPDEPLPEPLAEEIFKKLSNWVSDLFNADRIAPKPPVTRSAGRRLAERGNALPTPRRPTSGRTRTAVISDDLGNLDDNPAPAVDAATGDDLPGPGIASRPPFESETPDTGGVNLAGLDSQARIARLDALLAATARVDPDQILAEALASARRLSGDGASTRLGKPRKPPITVVTGDGESPPLETSRVTEPVPKSGRARVTEIQINDGPPLPPPDSKGRKQPGNDPWFRDADEANRQQRRFQRVIADPDQTPLPGEDARRGEAPPPPPAERFPLGETLTAALRPTGQDRPQVPFTSRDYGVPAPPPLGQEAGLDAPPPDPETALDDVLTATPEPSRDQPDELSALLRDAAPGPAPPPASSEAGLLDALIEGEPGDQSGDDAFLDALEQGNDTPPSGDDLLDALEGDGAKLDSEAAPKEDDGPKIALRIDQDGRPVLPSPWTSPVVRPGQDIPEKDIERALRRIDPLAPIKAQQEIELSLAARADERAAANGQGAWPVTRLIVAEDGEEREVRLGPRVEKAAEAPPLETETALIPVLPGDSRTVNTTGEPLNGVQLTMGIGATLQNIMLPERDPATGRPRDCLEKHDGEIAVCIMPLRWPAGFNDTFLVSTVLYTETSAIVRYEDGKATWMLALFQADGFEDLARWLAERYGAPTERVNRNIAPFGEKRRNNVVLSWRSKGAEGGSMTLEIRQVDDTRGGFPDLRYGAILLYRDGSPSIFPEISIHEILRLKRTG